MSFSFMQDVDPDIQSAERFKVSDKGNPPGAFCRNRLFEWIMTSIILGISIILLVGPNSLSKSRFFLITEFGIGQSAILLYCLMVGVIGCLALYWNGSWQYGSAARAVCCILRLVVWSQMALALAATSTVDAISISIAVCIGLTCGEFISFGRAIVDEGRR